MRQGIAFAVLIAVVPLGAWAAEAYSPSLQTPDLSCRLRNEQGLVIRSGARRALFLRLLGYVDGHGPAGFAVNHIVPLACGGCDVPSNMELMTTADWKARTGPERYDCGRHAGGLWSKPPVGAMRASTP